MKERRDKGLYYHCDSKWNLGHKYPNMKLFMVEGSAELMENALYEEGSEELAMVEEGGMGSHVKTNPIYLSMHLQVRSLLEQ